jgi:hypothetical protein
MTYNLTIQEIQNIIHFFTDKKIRSDKIKGYMNVKRGRLTGEKK